MKNVAKLVNKLRGMDVVVRWNFHKHLVQENIATHSFWVAVFTAILAPDDQRNELVFAAITHDMEEAITGDLPALVKAHTPQWDEVVKKAEQELFGGGGGNDADEIDILSAFRAARHTAEASIVIKLADLFAALMYARMEIELGNTHFQRIEKELIKSICKAAEKPHTPLEVASRAHYLLDTLGFDHTEGLDRPLEISHL